jgi:CRISPR/Cas system CMR-associated protein Cmr3 (group 5 of RAMP superfamily)
MYVYNQKPANCSLFFHIRTALYICNQKPTNCSLFFHIHTTIYIYNQKPANSSLCFQIRTKCLAPPAVDWPVQVSLQHSVS